MSTTLRLQKANGSRFTVCLGYLLVGLLAGVESNAAEARRKTENVFLIMSDGLRWQEVFTGAEERLISTNGGVKSIEALDAAFWRDTPEERRRALLPFFWSEIAQQGQLYGNQHKGSIARVTNQRRFSFPGYNEVLSGFVDPRIDSNAKKANPNTNVLEWLHTQPGFRGKVGALGAWDVFPYILNVERSRIPVWPEWDRKFGKIFIPTPESVRLLRQDTSWPWDDVTFDSFLLHTTLDYIKRERPRALFVGFCETDEWGHLGRYDVYLRAAQNLDRFIRELWLTAQSIPQYRDKTTFVITTDHGRGSGLTSWKDHGEKVPESDGVWVAFLGPDTPALGERINIPEVTQNQVASTVAAVLGREGDFRRENPRAGPPIVEAVSKVASR